MSFAPTRALFRRLALAALAAPLGACGGQIASVVEDASVDTGSVDAPVDAPADGGACAPQVAPIGCGDDVTYPCGLADPANPDQARCVELCPADSGTFSCWIDRPETGPAAVVHCTSCAVGRRPAGFVPARGARGQQTPLAAWLAEIAELEAAAVDAFDAMSIELAAHGAPRRLRVAARRARRDEVRHARVMRSAARRHGGRPSRARTPVTAVRSLEAIALENATEGCVRETWGALFAAFQAERASDPRLRRAFARIAADEARHAALSWSLHRWAERRLSREARARVEHARKAAIEALRREILVEPPRAIVDVAGAPRAHEAARLYDVMIAATG